MFKNHPKGLLAAALSNMGERFGYYIMNAVLVLFLCSKFGLSDESSGIISSFFYCGIYHGLIRILSAFSLPVAGCWLPDFGCMRSAIVSRHCATGGFWLRSAGCYR